METIDYLEPQTINISHNLLKPLAGLKKESLSKSFAVIQSSADVSGIEVRLLPPLIKDNHTTKIFPFPGYSKLYCLTIVVSDVTNQLAGTIDIKGFPRIGDNEYLPVNKTIFYWQQEKPEEKSPSQIHVFTSVIKSKEALRDVGTILTSVKSDTNYQGLVGSLGKLATDATVYGTVADIVMQVAGIVGKYLGNVEDKAIGTVINSYTTLHGDFDKLGNNKISYPTRDVGFDFEITVRDSSPATGEKAMAEKKKEAPEKVIVDMTAL
jgi:hypothetical protein